jgi:putative endopeptidase
MRSYRSGIVLILFLGLSLGLSVMASNDPTRGFDLGNLDKSCKPCDDFYQFASGGWMVNNPVPAAFAAWGKFSELAERNRGVLHTILEEAKTNSGPKGSSEQKIGDFYCSCMDTEKIEAEGMKPLVPELNRINEIKDLRGLMAEVARLHSYQINVLFRLSSTQDLKNNTQMITNVEQAGLGLPEPDYYTKVDDKSKQIRDEYVKHIARMFELTGVEPEKAASYAKTVMAIETKLAEASMTRVERRNPDAVYNKMEMARLNALAPDFSWKDYFHHVGLSELDDINVEQPKFFKHLNQQLKEIPVSDWKIYLSWHLVNASAPGLSSKFVDEDFNFKGKVLTGAKEILPRWQRCVRATDGLLGELLGEVYVKKTFTPEAKARALEMVRNLRAALKEDLSSLSWMGDKTRKEAIAKLDQLVNKIGYPDKWRDYSSLQIERNNYASNVLNASAFDFKRDLQKIGKPVDRTEWLMSPPTVNAYYNPLFSEIVFPAGILQPPFFDPNVDDAINYGGIGAVIGHELTHGFDDQGRKFDAKGNLRDWWTPEDAKNFQELSACVEKQFDSFVVEGDLRMNGKLVLGESIADLGGLTIALNAFRKAQQLKPQARDIDGFTPEQRFFLGWAQVWASNQRPEFMRLQVTTNPHPLPRFRVNGPLSNMPAFAEAFSCKQGDKMVREQGERCRIW